VDRFCAKKTAGLPAARLLRAYMPAEDRRALFPIFKRFPKIANQQCAKCKCGAEMTVLSAGSFAGSGVAHVTKHPTVGSASPPQNASQILRNPDFWAVRGVKTHIISGIRHQCCRPARSHTRSRAGKGKPDASLAPTPGFCCL
jgi:hypothetical protein